MQLRAMRIRKGRQQKELAKAIGTDEPNKAEPTSQQYDTIETAIETLIEKHGKFFIEFSTNDGSSVANRQYERGVPTSKILDDITYFYKNGKLPYER